MHRAITALALAFAVVLAPACADRDQPTEDVPGVDGGVAGPGGDIDETGALPADGATSVPVGRMDTATVKGHVTVVLTTFDIDMPSEVEAGPVTFHIRNTSDDVHGFAITGPDVLEELPEELEPGEETALTIALQPGSYEIYCPVDEHREKGMEHELEVKAESGPEPPAQASGPRPADG